MACNNPMFGWVARWMGFRDYVPTVPQLYWNVDGNEQRYHLLCKQLHKLICYADMLGQKINLDHTAVEELEKQFEKFIESGFEDYYAEQIEKWVNDHLLDLYRLLVKQVFFGLTDDGHFCAYIPDSWADIQFDTGAVFGRTDYGRLILRFSADGAINNTYSYSLAQDTPLESLIADLEVTAKRGDAAFDTLFTNLDQEVVINGNI